MKICHDRACNERCHSSEMTPLPTGPRVDVFVVRTSKPVENL